MPPVAGFQPPPLEQSAPETEMQTHLRRVLDIGGRLSACHDALLGLIGRLYGEGQSASESKPMPRAAGLSNELMAALTGVEAVSERIETGISRLNQLA